MERMTDQRIKVSWGVAAVKGMAWLHQGSETRHEQSVSCSRVSPPGNRAGFAGYAGCFFFFSLPSRLSMNCRAVLPEKLPCEIDHSIACPLSSSPLTLSLLSFA